jgi:putative hemolysin
MQRNRAISMAAAVALALAMAPGAASAAEESEAAEYCTNQGGTVVALKPYLNAGSDNQTELGGSLQVCQFIQQDGDNVSQTVVDLTTLHSEKPTLAALAYIAAVPSSDSGAAGSNPAASYCPDDLGGTEQFGTASTGAWVGDLDPGMEAGDTEPLSDVINLCVFADRSAIDDFGLFYHSAGETRGVDLTTVMRYQANEETPAAF